MPRHQVQLNGKLSAKRQTFYLPASSPPAISAAKDFNSRQGFQQQPITATANFSSSQFQQQPI
jgi:hypothetical protein